MKLHRHETSEASDFTVSEVIRLNGETEGFLGSTFADCCEYCSFFATRNTVQTLQCVFYSLRFLTIVSANVTVDLNQGAPFKCTLWRELKVW